MKYSLAICLLIGNASLASAMRLNQKFMPDVVDDDSLVKEVSKLTSISEEDEDMVNQLYKKEQE